MLGRMDDATLTRSRNSRNEPGIARGVWIVLLLALIPLGVVGFLRYRVSAAGQHAARPTEVSASAIASPPPPSTAITVIAPPAKEPVAESSTPAKKKRRPKAHRASRALQELQRAQLEAADR